MAGFEPETSVIGSDRSANYATTTAQGKCSFAKAEPTCLAMSTLPSQSSIKFLADAARRSLKWNNLPSKNVGRQISNGMGAPQASLAMMAISTPYFGKWYCYIF